jgi:Rieske Fe-S protein
LDKYYPTVLSLTATSHKLLKNEDFIMSIEKPVRLGFGRRKFIKEITALGGLFATSSLLAACGDPTATPIPTPTAVPTTVPATAPAGFDPIGPLSNFKPEADPVAFTVKEKKGFVFNRTGQFYVFSNICTHQGCEVPFDKEQMKFVCPCHGSQYDKTGEVIKGPAPARLPQFEFKVVGDTLFGKLS